MCVLILVYMCPHTSVYVSTYLMVWQQCCATLCFGGTAAVPPPQLCIYVVFSFLMSWSVVCVAVMCVAVSVAVAVAQSCICLAVKYLSAY
jgi:hypothetical protein